jgi:hypothetical protein
MNNTFRRGFNNCFTKSFLNNKYQFNLLHSSLNQGAFRINYSNKTFLTRVLHLNGSYGLLSNLLNRQVISGSIGSSKDLLDSEVSELQSDVNDGLVVLGDLFFFRDDCKWTCGSTRLVSGPQTPVLVRTKID